LISGTGRRVKNDLIGERIRIEALNEGERSKSPR